MEGQSAPGRSNKIYRMAEMVAVEGDNMGSEISQDDQEALAKLKKFIMVEHANIAPPLIYTKIGKTIFKGFGEEDGIKVYVFEVEKIDCNNDGEEMTRTNFVMRYLFYGGRIKSLETYREEKRLKSRKRREVYFK